MKKTLVLALLLLFTSVTYAQFSVQPHWTAILDDKPATIQTQLNTSTESLIRVNVQVPGFYTINVTTERGQSKVITVPKAPNSLEAGMPDMPYVVIPAIIGDHAHMEVRVVDAQYEEYQGIEIAPSKGNISRQVDPSTMPYPYGACYTTNAFFPTQQVDLDKPYILRDFRGQNMMVYPFAYNAVTKTLRVYYNMTLEMKSHGNGGDNQFTRKSNEIKMDPEFAEIYSNKFINYQAVASKYTAIGENGELLIICHSSFTSAMTEFVNWKITIGRPTTLVSTSTTGTSSSAIQTYIRNYYNTHPNLTHVLLVGDCTQIPGVSMSSFGSYSGLSDQRYGQISGNDYYNELIIGRFSANSTAEVTTQVNRTITYERDLNSSATWLKKGLGVSTSAGNNGHYNEDDYQHIDLIRDDLLGYTYSTVYQEYHNVSGYSSSSTSTISNRINSGVGIINYCNHGSETEWQSHYYNNGHVNALTNSNKLPFIISVACLNGKYDYSSGDCFAETWMHATNGSTTTPTGAVGGIFSYISQPWVPPMWGQDEMIDILVESYSNNIKRTLGGVLTNGNMAVLDNGTSSSSQSNGTYCMWNIFGDPTLTLRTNTPGVMTVNHAGSINLAATSYDVTVVNGNGSLATITKDNTILGSATVSGSQAHITLSSAPGEIGELTLCVFGYNKVTYLGTINVVGGEQYEVSLTADPTEGGTLTGAGTYYETQQVTVTATPNRGYAFVNWTEDDEVVSTEPSYSFTVTGDADLTAHFNALEEHTFSVLPSEHGNFTISPTTAYAGETVTLTPNPDPGYCLSSWNVTTVSKEAIPVTNNQFIMPDADVIVSAVFTEGFTVTLLEADHGSFTATPTTALQGQTIVLTPSPEQGYSLSSWVVYQTGNTSTTVTVSNNQFTMPAYDVTVAAFFTKPLGGDITIGSGTATNNYIPTYAYYSYSLTEQIYTPTEIGTSGTITAIAFKVSNSKSTTRSVDLYMKHTTKSAFANNTGWEAVSSSNKVFSGSVSFSASGWTTITLSTPFQYNGTSNLLIAMDDNTGTYVSYSSNSPQFYVYSTGGNRALRVYNDDTNYNPASPSSYSGTLVTSNNQITLSITVEGSNASLVVSPETLDDFSYTEGEGASTPQSLSLIGNELSGNVTLSAPAHFELCNTYDGNYTSTLVLNPSNGQLRKTVYVRMIAGLETGEYLGETLTITCGELNKSVTLSGNVISSSHWTVVPELYANNMTVLAVIQINGVEQNNPDLQVGALHDGECRGFGSAIYCPPVSRYIIPLVVYGEEGEDFHFMLYMLYDPQQDLEMDSDASYDLVFSENGYGTINEPVILDFGGTVIPETYTYRVNLNPGWNWCSFPIEMNGNGLTTLTEFLGSTCSIIKGDVGHIEYSDGEWIGILSSIDNKDLVMINAEEAVSFEWTGLLAKPSDHPITINNGWNWISFLSTTPMSIDEAFNDLNPMEGDQIKSSAGVCIYTDGQWLGDFNMLRPGQGYLYLSLDDTKTFTYPESTRKH